MCVKNTLSSLCVCTQQHLQVAVTESWDCVEHGVPVRVRCQHWGVFQRVFGCFTHYSQNQGHTENALVATSMQNTIWGRGSHDAEL